MEILNQEVVEKLTKTYESIVIFCLVLAVVSLIGAIIFASSDCLGGLITCIVMCILLFVAGWIIASNGPTYAYHRYEVILDESVSITDIYEKYEVVEQRGDIWVLEDKKGE